MATTSWQTGEDPCSVFQRRCCHCWQRVARGERVRARAQRKSAAPRLQRRRQRDRAKAGRGPAASRPARARRPADSVPAENVHVVPVFGAGGLKVSPRIGISTSPSTTCPGIGRTRGDSNTVDVVGLPPGEHKVLIELVDPQHQVFTGCLTCRQDRDIHDPAGRIPSALRLRRAIFSRRRKPGWSNPRLSLLFSFQSSAKRPYQSL